MGGHAVVVGTGVSGLLAGRVLAERFERVTLLDRDPAGDAPASVGGGPGFRKGVPQGRHLHTLAARGAGILEGYFPGLDAELAAMGCPAVDQAWDAETHTPQGRLPRFRSGLVIRSASRSLLESHLRHRLLADHPNVRLLSGVETTGLLVEDRRATGVRTSRGNGPQEETLSADLVVDASGAGSRAPRWLEGIGYDAPEEEVVDAGLVYATRWYKAPVGLPEGSRGISILPDWPGRPRGGTMRLVEGGLVTVVLVGLMGQDPPTDEEGFLEFARGLPSPAIHDAITSAGLVPVSPVYGFRRTANRRRRYERVRLPEGFLVAGDAALALNPSYGTGMTSAALSATALEAALVGGGGRGLGRRFQRLQARACEPCWTTTTSSDRLWASDARALGPVPRLLHRVSNEVFALAVEDAGVARALLEVKNVLRPPRALARPRILIPALARTLSPVPRRPREAAPTTPGADGFPERAGVRER